MPRMIPTWVCGKCGRVCRDFEEARQCETDHILRPVLDKFTEDLNRIFSRTPKRPAKLKPKD